MVTIELIYYTDCPNVGAARDELREALEQSGLKPVWTEWDREADESPDYTRRLGSPTILVNGQDVSGTSDESNTNFCRLYTNAGGRLCGTPSAADIQAAVRATTA